MIHFKIAGERNILIHVNETIKWIHQDHSGSFLSQGEEDLMATLRKRDHAILKQEKKVEEMETWP